jgi:hypothetical protein
MILIGEFPPSDGPEDGGKLFVQADLLKQDHIIDTSVSKLSTVLGSYFSISLVVWMEMSSPFVVSGMSSCVR